MKCAHCFAEIPEVSAFCPMCGAAIAGDSHVSPDVAASNAGVMEGDGPRGESASSPWMTASETAGEGAVPPVEPPKPKKGQGIARVISIASGILVIIAALSWVLPGNESTAVSQGETAVGGSYSSTLADSSGVSTSEYPGETVCEFSGIRYRVPSSWNEVKDDEGNYHYTLPHANGANITVAKYDDLDIDSDVDPQIMLQAIEDGFVESGIQDIESSSVVDVGNAKGYRISYTWYSDEEERICFTVSEMVFFDGVGVEIAGVCRADDSARFEDEFCKVLDTVTLV